MNVDDFKKEKLEEYISPEGMEEKKITSVHFHITQTQAGKFRVYVDDNTFDVCENQEEAFKRMGRNMLMIGGLFYDPDTIFNQMFNPKDKKDGK
jgi:hypothetical protein